MRRPYTQLYCHLVWGTWDRQPLISPGVEARLYGALAAKIRSLRGVPIAIGGVDDHVHVLCSFDPAVAISYLVQQVKGASSHLMTHEVVGQDAFKWQGAYGAFTVSRGALDDVREYVLNQKKHHADSRLWAEWEHTWLPDPPVLGP